MKEKKQVGSRDSMKAQTQHECFTGITATTVVIFAAPCSQPCSWQTTSNDMKPVESWLHNMHIMHTEAIITVLCASSFTFTFTVVYTPRPNEPIEIIPWTS